MCEFQKLRISEIPKLETYLPRLLPVSNITMVARHLRAVGIVIIVFHTVVVLMVFFGCL